MRIFITGINGFIGSNLARRLVRDGHEVSGLIRKTSNLSFIRDLKLCLFCSDLSNFDLLCQAFEGQDVVFHVAALASDWGPFEQFRKINLEGTQNVVKAAEKAKVKRLVHISSTAVYGFSGYRFRRETDPKADTPFPYCVTKRAAEDWLRRYASQNKINISIIQPGNVYGPYDRTFFIKFAKALEKGQLAYVDNGRAWTCPVYVENLIDALCLAGTRKEAIGETFIITDGLNIAWREFTQKVAEQLGTKPPRISINFHLAYAIAHTIESFYQMLRIKHAPQITRYRVCNAGRDYHFSIMKARQLLGYSPKIPLDVAIERTVQWYRAWRQNPGRDIRVNLSNNPVYHNKLKIKYLTG